MDLSLNRNHAICLGESNVPYTDSIASGWRVLESGPWLQVGEDGFIPDFPLDGALVVPLKLWRLRREDLVARNEPLGVLLDSNDDPEAIASDLTHFALIVIPFSRFAEDRGDSIARLLRGRYDYRGELRVIRQVLPTACRNSGP